MERLQQGHSGGDEEPTHDDGAKNAQEEHPVPVLGGHGEEREDDQEDEDVIDAEREFDDVRGQELDALA